MKTTMQEFEEELNKLKLRGATGISMFLGLNLTKNVDDYAKEALLYLKCMNKEETDIVV